MKEKRKQTVTAVILTKNNQDLISDCLNSLRWVDEIVVIDTGSEDRTVEIAKKYTSKIYSLKKGNFSYWRNYGAQRSGGDWIFYVDSDETVGKELRKEIIRMINKSSRKHSSYAIPRKNIFLGKHLKHGGWWPDYVLRLIERKSFIKWEGELHEQPKTKGSKKGNIPEAGKLENPLVHFSHRSLTEMVDKTNDWSEIEARLLYNSGHPEVKWWRFLSVAFREFYYRGIKKMGFLDGRVGIIEIIYQMYSRMITYAKLWELQIAGGIKKK